MDEDLSRFADTFGALIERQSRQLRDRVSSFAASLQRFSDRLGEAIAGITSAATSAPAAAVATPSGGVQLVRVVNTQSQPVFVQMTGERPQRSSRGGFFANLMGGIGGLFGGLLGGLFGGFLGGSGITLAVVIGELIGALGMAIPLVVQARRLVSDLRSFALVVLRGIQGIIGRFFRELRSGGILPVSSLIASLLLLIDRGIVLVLTHVQPLIEWVGQLIQALGNWLGDFVDRLSVWVRGVLNRLPGFLGELLAYLLETRVRPALQVILNVDVREAIRGYLRDVVQALVGVFAGGAAAMGNVIIESFRWAGDWIAYAIGSVLNELPFVELDVRRPQPLGDRIFEAVGRSFREAGQVGEYIAEQILPPRARRVPRQTVGPTEAPTLRLPRFRRPELEIPSVPTPELALERLLETAPRRPTRPAEAVPVGAPPPVRPRERARAGEVTLNGGIHVQITAETIDREHADETARMIADQVLAEIRRLNELARFRQGLSTAPLT
jgi:hypothetical protein